MFLTDISVAESGITALLGYAVVFFGLILLMLVMILLGKIFTAVNEKANRMVIVAEPEPAPVKEAPVAPGSAGGVKLHNVEPKTAAMLMAIVADQLGKPLNELRFISIKEVEK